jgi:hypothetical protein
MLIPWMPFTDQEIANTIQSSPNKAPRPDNSPFLIFRRAYDAIPGYFNALYRELGDCGYHPKCWRTAITCIIPKPNKPSYSIAKAYRPITLLNCLAKALEKVIATRLAYWANISGDSILHRDQLRGRPQRSAIDTAMALAVHVDAGWNDSLMTSALFLDICGAFDNVPRVRLLQIMEYMKLPPQIQHWTESILPDREMAFASDNRTSPMKPVETGIPQGSPVSPHSLSYLHSTPLPRARWHPWSLDSNLHR